MFLKQKVMLKFVTIYNIMFYLSLFYLNLKREPPLLKILYLEFFFYDFSSKCVIDDLEIHS